ncbi:uncharacterized protein LOC108883801 isoform X2 [Lates calcarifer]|uniref:Uncharacterized protein LOC108883801 isoform X2 n=1 Tax=Lates calcarifer TaxID=8187 RepID=A0AAJ8DP55_LATCA|nr:uncharacterized protein LOC108883801 isoform X2 [Lates calcarifer]
MAGPCVDLRSENCWAAHFTDARWFPPLVWPLPERVPTTRVRGMDALTDGFSVHQQTENFIWIIDSLNWTDEDDDEGVFCCPGCFISEGITGTLVVNVAQTFYQAEENHHITLEWTFTPKTLSSSNIYIFCQQITDQKVSVLFHLHEGVEVSESQDEQFSGRVQFDKDVLREGRLRLHVSRLRTEDSGLYLCDVKTESGSSSDKCRLNVTATHQITCPTEPIQAEEGGDVSLQCRLDPSVDLRKETLDFTRADLNREDDVVHSYSDEKDRTYRQMDQYRGRTTLIHEDLIRGIISLNISSLTLTDSGLYTCYVPGLADSATITLTVVRKDQDNRTNTTTIEPEKPGAEKMNVGAIVGGVHGALIGLGLILIGVLVKLGIIKNRCGTDQQVAADRSQTEELNPAGNGLINVVSEV